MNNKEKLQTPVDAKSFTIKFGNIPYYNWKQDLYIKFFPLTSALDGQLRGMLDYEIVIMCSKYFDEDSDLDAVIAPMFPKNMKL